jgi:hypothetical protein
MGCSLGITLEVYPFGPVVAKGGGPRMAISWDKIVLVELLAG